MATVDFLIRRNDTPALGPGKIPWKRGDIVGWKIQPHTGWGAAEDPDNFASAADCGFVIFTVVNMPEDSAIFARLEESEWNPIDATQLLKKRLRGISWADLPNNVRNSLVDSGRATRQWTGVKKWIKNKVTGETE